MLAAVVAYLLEVCHKGIGQIRLILNIIGVKAWHC